jgi:hypothetical protein
VLRIACRLPPLRAVFLSPGPRLLALQASALGFAALLALRAPLISLWLGAALFGVPHVIAGIRATAVRRELSTLTLGAALAGVFVGAAQLCGLGDTALRAFVALFTLSLAAEVVASPAARARRVAWVSLLVLAAWPALAWPTLAVLVFSHLHGLGAIAYFVVCARRRRLPAWLFAGGAVALLLAGGAGGLDSWMASTLFAPRHSAASILAEAGASAWPSATGAMFHRALFLYAFGQSLHFAIWLRLMPELDRATRVPKPFRRQLADLRLDFGRLATPLLWLCAGGGILLLFGSGAAREVYFALTYFHVGLEGAALLGLALTQKHPRPEPESQQTSLAPVLALGRPERAQEAA